MRHALTLAFLAYLVLLESGWGDPTPFCIRDTGSAVEVSEAGRLVLVYNYTPVSPPASVSGLTPRSCYIHPLYGLDGDVLTEDWPADHYHHRGVFWAWPWCQVGGKRMDLWLSRDAHQCFEKWITRSAQEEQAVLEVENSWRFDSDPKVPLVRERIRITIYRADSVGRPIDFDIKLTNLTDGPVVLQGQQDSSKGYGGFCFRADAKRQPLVFTSALGVQSEDAFELGSPWLDLSSANCSGGGFSGVAIFQHPGNPGFPHKGWLVRHYGFLGASWPHTAAYEISPHNMLQLRYRLYVHRGNAEEGQVAARFSAFLDSAK